MNCGMAASTRSKTRSMLPVNPTVEKRKRESRDNDDEAPKQKKKRCCNDGTTEPFIPKPVLNVDADRLSTDKIIFKLASSANRSRADFEEKYSERSLIGKGGFGSVYKGYRKLDRFPVAIKHIPLKDVKRKKVRCKGKAYKVILEVALMLKAAGLPGSGGQSGVVPLLDCYMLHKELILVMERPPNCRDLLSYLESNKEPLSEHKAKMILKQLVDTAIHMHTNDVFHQDIKLQNVLVETVSGQPIVQVIDFGCSSFSVETSYHNISGTPEYFPPEWFDLNTHWAHSTTVWQLGSLFYELLHGYEGYKQFSTKNLIRNKIKINSELSSDVKSLLNMCLDRNPLKRATLEELQLHPALAGL